jgi:hypothetical protein
MHTVNLLSRHAVYMTGGLLTCTRNVRHWHDSYPGCVSPNNLLTCELRLCCLVYAAWPALHMRSLGSAQAESQLGGPLLASQWHLWHMTVLCYTSEWSCHESAGFTVLLAGVLYAASVGPMLGPCSWSINWFCHFMLTSLRLHASMFNDDILWLHRRA